MKETIQDMAHQLFFDICGKKPTDVDLFFIKEIYFPKIEYEPRMTVYLPAPRRAEGTYIIQNSVFADLELSQSTIFTLFFASICHAAAHAKITNFGKYKKWMKNKNKKRAYETFEFIEDIRANEFLKNEFPEYYSEIKKIDEIFIVMHEKNNQIDKNEYVKKQFSDKFIKNNEKHYEVLREQIMQVDTNDEIQIMQIAEKIYNSSDIENNIKFPYVDHISHPKKLKNGIKILE